MNKLSEKGTSLVELLIIISLLSLFITIFSPLLFSSYIEQEVEILKNQFQSDINWALQYADVNQGFLFLTFQPNNHSYFISLNNKRLISRGYDSRINLEHNYVNSQIVFHPDGTISSGGTIKLFWDGILKYTLYIQLSTGNVREESY